MSLYSARAAVSLLPGGRIAMSSTAIAAGFPVSLLRGPVPGFSAPFLVQADAAAADMPLADVLARLADSRAWLRDVLHERGALLLRGFNALRTGEQVEAVARTLSPNLMDYRGGTSVRSQVTAGVVTEVGMRDGA